MREDTTDNSAPARFARDVGRALAVDLTKAAGYLIVTSSAGAVGLLVWQGGTVPAWVAVGGFFTALALGFALQRCAAGRLRRDALSAESERTALGAKAATDAATLERHETYAGHVAQALDALQRIVADEIDTPIPDYVEAGILEPARDLIRDKPAKHVRLSVLLRREDGERWWMSWAAGHSVAGKAKYDQRIVDTLSRHTFESGQAQHWPDVTVDSAFRQNPMASRITSAMLSVPIRRGDRTLGVFNVLSSEPQAFDSAEERYVASLGALISVAVGIHLKDHFDRRIASE